MSLEHLHLTQFRSWARFTYTPDARPTAIFGPNGAGKTNILEAISMLSPGRGMRAALPADQARKGMDVGWRIRARLHGPTGGHEVQTSAPPGQPRDVSLDEKPAPQTALAALVRVIWLTPAMDRLWADAPEGRRRFLDRLTLSFQPSHAGDVLSYEKAMRERNRLLKDQVRDPGWYRALEANMAENGAAITRNRLDAILQITQSQQGAATSFPAAHLSLLAGDAAADDTDPASIAARLAEMRPRDMAAGRTLSGAHRADMGAYWGPHDMPAALSSTGEQKALLLSLILANARALQGEHVILLLDEVAAHLDTDRRAALYDEISALPAQAFLTGTGPELFEALRGRARFLSVGRDDTTSFANEIG